MISSWEMVVGFKLHSEREIFLGMKILVKLFFLILFFFGRPKEKENEIDGPVLIKHIQAPELF